LPDLIAQRLLEKWRNLMRLWSVSPEYLDPMGLVALWREGLLAQKVLLGQTRGYKSHPQLDRFRACPDPVSMIGCYLAEVAKEADRRGYRFDVSRIVQPCSYPKIRVQQGQIDYEWNHLLAKLKRRSPMLHAINITIAGPRSHPLFEIVPGGVEEWERT
jgi:hypothetical protein